MLPDLRQNCNAKHSAIIRKADITPLDFRICCVGLELEQVRDQRNSKTDC